MHDIAGHGGREQHRLPFLGQHRRNAAHILDETHVEHAVGLVHDEGRGVVQPQLPLFDKVEQTARCRHQNINAARQHVDLAALANAANNHAMAQFQAAAIDAQGLIDLHGQFARRCQNQRAGSMQGCGFGFLRQLLQKRQAKGRRLASAGLGQTQNVFAVQKGGNGLHLNGGGGGIFLGFQHFQKCIANAEGGEGVNGYRVVLSDRFLMRHNNFQCVRRTCEHAHASRLVAVFHAHLERTVIFENEARGDDRQRLRKRRKSVRSQGQTGGVSASTP